MLLLQSLLARQPAVQSKAQPGLLNHRTHVRMRMGERATHKSTRMVDQICKKVAPFEQWYTRSKGVASPETAR